MKYIILNDGMNSPILFPTFLDHSDIAANRPVISAGYCNISFDGDDVEVSVYGDSFSMEIGTREEDAKHIRRMIKLSQW